MISTRKLSLAIAITASLSALAAPAADAAFPGNNGRVAFAELVGPEFKIFSMNPDGSGLMQLTSGATSDTEPAWSANGSRIVFARLGPSFTDEIWVMNPDGSGQTRLTSGASDRSPAFLPDGRIVFTRLVLGQGGSLDIWIMNGDGSGQTQLTSDPTEEFEPTASPTGQLIAFARGPFFDTDIITMTPSGAAQTAVTTGDFKDEGPNFSPDGGRIAFSRCDSGEGCGSAARIVTVAATGGAVGTVTPGGDAEVDPSDLDPAYAPDGTQIVFRREAPDFSTNLLAFVPAAGGPIRTSLPGFDPDWQPVALAGRCFNEPVTIAGTHGNDTIIGTPGNDVIRGFRGRDRISGKGGDDILCGGRAKDRIYGKKGDDVLIGGAHADFLNGGPGKNRLFGGTPGAEPEKGINNVCVVGPKDSQSNCQVIK